MSNPEEKSIHKEPNMVLAQAVDQVLKERNWSLSQAQIRTGVNRGTINNMRQGIGAGSKHIAQFARAIASPGQEDETVRDWLKMAGKEEALLVEQVRREHSGPLVQFGPEVDMSPLRQIPLVPSRIWGDSQSSVGLLDKSQSTLDSILPSDYRAIEVAGDGMEPFYQSGDILLVQPSKAATPGDKVLALVDGDEVTCKVFRMNETAWLEPASDGGRIEAPRFEIIGVVKALLRPER